VAVASAGPHASLHLAPDRQPHQQSDFLQAGCPSCRPTDSVKALKAGYLLHTTTKFFIVRSTMWRGGETLTKTNLSCEMDALL